MYLFFYIFDIVTKIANEWKNGQNTQPRKKKIIDQDFFWRSCKSKHFFMKLKL